MSQTQRAVRRVSRLSVLVTRLHHEYLATPTPVAFDRAARAVKALARTRRHYQRKLGWTP